MMWPTKPTRRDRLLAAAVTAAALSYLPFNRRRGPTHVLYTAADSQLPLVPLITIPYLLFLPLFWLTVTYSFLRGQRWRRLGTALLVTDIVSDLAFALYPTSTPRPAVVRGRGARLLRYVYAHDQPVCDLPSEHASNAVIFALYLWPTPARRLGLAAATTVLPATVLTRQHTLAGTAGGALLGATVWFLLPTRQRGRRTGRQSGTKR